jgi:predicted heme/steroid binding protein
MVIPSKVKKSKIDTGEKRVENSKTFSKEELRQFDGKNGRRAYIAYKGKVYDVTDSYQWIDGDHLGHLAGLDLTEQMDIAPHEGVVMEKMILVGIYSDSQF